MANRGFIIYTATEQVRVEAKTLAAAVAGAGIDEKTPILAAVQADCVPAPSAHAPPFFAVLLRNPQFREPGTGR